MNLFLKKLYRFFILIVLRKRGSIINHLGSVISPTDFSFQTSKKMAHRVGQFKNLIRPIILKQNKMKRYGSKGDGGYVVSKKAIEKSSFLISGGIESNNEFEIELAKLGILGVQIDNSIDLPPKFHENLEFIKATLGDLSEVDINNLTKKFPKNKSGILKLDIEGSEYSVLESIHDFNRFNAIIIELHELFLITDDIFWESFKKILIRLKNTHNVIYISPNNCCGYSIIGGVPVPNIMEITWVKKSLLAGKKFSKIDTLHPSKMKGNYSNRAQLDITGFFPEWKL